jgi:hypothetical protein
VTRLFSFRASIIVLVAALAFYGIGFLVGAFDNIPLTLVAGLLTILGLALEVLGARPEQR